MKPAFPEFTQFHGPEIDVINGEDFQTRAFVLARTIAQWKQKPDKDVFIVLVEECERLNVKLTNQLIEDMRRLEESHGPKWAGIAFNQINENGTKTVPMEIINEVARRTSYAIGADRISIRPDIDRVQSRKAVEEMYRRARQNTETSHEQRLYMS